MGARTQEPGEQCAACREFTPDLQKHVLTCPGWAGDAEPDWGCRTCRLVWIGPRGRVCPRCLGYEIVGFWEID